MSLVATASTRAVASLMRPSLLKYVLFAIALNAVILTLLITSIPTLFSQWDMFGEWDWLATIFSGLGATLLAWFLFPILLPLLISFFDTAIADKLEKQEYPQSSEPQPPFWPTLAQDAGFTVKALLLNIIVLPLYFVPLVNIVLYYVLNGYLLSREFFHVVAGRHISPEEARALKSKHKFSIFMIGVSIAFFATIPFINLVTPLWGVVAMVHAFHIIQGTPRG